MAKHWAVESAETRALIAEQLAILTLRGVGLNAAVKELQKEANFPVTRTTLVGLKKHPKFHEVIQKDAERRIESGTLEARLGCIDLVPDCLEALKKEIKRGNIKAIDTAIRTAIGNDKKEAPEQQQAIQIIMPTGVGSRGENPV